MNLLSVVLVILAIGLGSFFASGIKTGSMPNRFGTAERKQSPVRFWVWGFVIIVMSATCLWGAYSSWVD
ncbi:hypothetical protein BH09PSE4_BH09PSE4_13270 [soil metagenome]